MLNFFLTIIAGIIALGLISSLILGFIQLYQKNKADTEYQERVDNAMDKLRKETGNPNL